MKVTFMSDDQMLVLSQMTVTAALESFPVSQFSRLPVLESSTSSSSSLKNVVLEHSARRLLRLPLARLICLGRSFASDLPIGHAMSAGVGSTISIQNCAKTAKKLLLVDLVAQVSPNRGRGNDKMAAVSPSRQLVLTSPHRVVRHETKPRGRES